MQHRRNLHSGTYTTSTQTKFLSLQEKEIYLNPGFTTQVKLITATE